jgi:hypothetical protein
MSGLYGSLHAHVRRDTVAPPVAVNRRAIDYRGAHCNLALSIVKLHGGS